VLNRNGLGPKPQLRLLDPYGRRTLISGTDLADFGFTGHFTHKVSRLLLAAYRVYDPDLGRWLSRDLIAEDGGINLYAYCGGDPINCVDPLGLAVVAPAPVADSPTVPRVPGLTTPAEDRAAVQALKAGGRSLGWRIAGRVFFIVGAVFDVATVGTAVYYAHDTNRLLDEAEAGNANADVAQRQYEKRLREVAAWGPGKRAYHADRAFRDWFHRVYKPGCKKHGGAEDQNPDLDDQEIEEGYQQWLQQGSPGSGGWKRKK